MHSSAPVKMELASYTLELAQRARDASRPLAFAAGQNKDDWLHLAAERLTERTEEILAANSKDIQHAPKFELTEAQVDRLRFTPQRIEQTAQGLRDIISLPNPVGRILDSNVRPNGLLVNKVSVPLGVLFFIYESRPNVTVDAAGLAVKSGNAIILRGGKEAIHTNLALYQILSECLTEAMLPANSVQLVETPDRAAVGHLLKLHNLIDLVIPRGGESLIRRVAQEATMPLLKHYDGICHVYVDRAADKDTAIAIVVNSKCQRPGVCNAVECLLIHRALAERCLPEIGAELKDNGVELRGCDETCRILPGIKRATNEDYGSEYLDLILSVKVVDDLEEALDHISRFGSNHTDAIVTRDLDAARRFTIAVDSAAVMVNASTRFNDGFEFGLGAEIGISTDKLHARGPCGLNELCSYKYVVLGDGQTK